MSVLKRNTCLSGIKSIKDKSIDFIFTSPPYNFSTKRKDCYYNTGYSDIDNLTEEDFIKIRVDEFKDFKRILKPKRVIAYNFSYGLEMPHLPITLLSKIISKTWFTVCDYISWKKPHAIPFQTSPRKLSKITEMIYILVRKSEVNSYFMNKEVAKVNEKTGQTFYKNYTNFIEAKNNDRIKTNLKATFSTDLAMNMLKMYTIKGDRVLDPFMGIGTTGVACKKMDRKFTGIELSNEFFDIAKKRIEKRCRRSQK